MNRYFNVELLERGDDARKMMTHLMAKMRLAGFKFHPEEFGFLAELSAGFGVNGDEENIVGFIHRYPIRKDGKVRGVFKSDVEEAFHAELEEFMRNQTCFVAKSGEPVFFVHDFGNWLKSKGVSVE